MLINIEEQNPQLFSFVEELQQIKKLRQGKITNSNWFKKLPTVTNVEMSLSLIASKILSYNGWFRYNTNESLFVLLSIGN